MPVRFKSYGILFLVGVAFAAAAQLIRPYHVMNHAYSQIFATAGAVLVGF